MTTPALSGSRTYGIGLYAPAGFPIEQEAVERPIARLAALGHRVVVDPTCGTRWQRFSATDDERLAAVMRMNAHPDVELLIAARGGYGWSRLLDQLDFRAIAQAGKRWLGHSDFTAFQLAALVHAGMTTFAGPTAAYDFGAAEPAAFTFDHCFRLLGAGDAVVDCTLAGPDIDCAGTLWGGNLAMIAHLVGTRHWPSIDGGILFIEDIGEHPYRIERMLHQLHFAGVLRAAAGRAVRRVQRLCAGRQRQRLRPRHGNCARADAFRCSDPHRPAFRPLPGQADVAGRRALRAHRAGWCGASCAFRLRGGLTPDEPTARRSAADVAGNARHPSRCRSG